MPYDDGFVAAVPATNRQKYIEHAEQARRVDREGCRRLDQP
ncbi:MAG: DUF1428 domain-containing protein [Gammaproteobacteria bacterium]|nr:DUF1428 domain-containing protein [Gammaproteobacteria bacterium]MDH3447003.1 DUF1428 domain-containing protein [Gammaproteobacteria bacterium]